MIIYLGNKFAVNCCTVIASTINKPPTRGGPMTRAFLSDFLASLIFDFSLQRCKIDNN